MKKDVAGKTIIHTTSAGTQGIINAVYAGEIITGSLVNAEAVAKYIIARQPQTVSLVCMGNGGVRLTPEDEHFFDKSRQNIFQEADFYMCVKYNKFPFVITIEKDETGFVTKKKNVLPRPEAS